MKKSSRTETEHVAGNGLLHRRMFLAAGAAMGAGALADPAGAAPLPVEPWMQIPGAPFNGYGQPSKYEAKVARTFASAPGTGGTGSARTPHHLLNGMITPSGLHYERSHSGIPDINPDVHRLLIHGLVKRPLVFTLDDLGRYPMQSRIAFLECAGNSGALFAKTPAPVNVQAIHGLLSCSEWTGVKLSVLLEEAGIDPSAKWLLAEGADAAGMSRSVPLEKALDDAMVCLYQNGERVRPANGYPMRLLLPGFEGNMNVKWLRRIKLTAGPTMTKDETSKYTILLPSGKALQFVFSLEGKSMITHPSPGLTMRGPGLYESPASRGRATARLPRWKCRPTAARAGASRLCRSRCFPRRSRGSAWRGNGTADLRCCRAARPTKPAMCNRTARSSSRCAAIAATSTTT